MNMNVNFTRRQRIVRFPYSSGVKSIVLAAITLTLSQTTLYAQKPLFTQPSWYFGAAAGANFNFYRGSTQQLDANFKSPVAFHNGNGVGLFLAPLIEYHAPYTKLGFMFQAGYDSRRSSFKEVTAPCNCPADLSTKLSYLTIEPSVRYAPFRSNFYLFGGPRFAFNMDKSFVYKQGTNPEYPAQVANPDVKGDLSNVHQTLISMQIGAGVDLPLSSQDRQTQFVFSPFVSFQPYFGQSPRSIETWSLTTLRVGAALKFGRGRDNTIDTNAVVTPTAKEEEEKGKNSDSSISFAVYAPKNIPVERRIRETFPLRNYVFFDLGSTAIPNRYVALKKDQVKEFKEDQLDLFTPKNWSGRSERQMIVYYNVINILGDRMGKNPTSTITLVGSSEKGPEDGRAMAESVKQYLVEVFSINPSRINIQGRDKPKIPSEQPGGTEELTLLREGDRRVSIESSSPALLMEFQMGPNAPLKPVEVVALQTAPIESYATFSVAEGNDTMAIWSLEIKDEEGVIQYFGPYPKSQKTVSIPGKSILGTRPEGDFVVTLTGQTKSGKLIKKETKVHMVLWTPPTTQEVTRFSVIYEFNESKAISLYEKYLREIVIPKIPEGGTVIIHGHTDIIGDQEHNQALSTARANDVKRILESELRKVGRKDVTFQVFGFGEDQSLSPFENRFPEERFYNRTVMIDIVPKL
jgi:outer membrane protein OmpA-like peptidoglycan-associated protein